MSPNSNASFDFDCRTLIWNSVNMQINYHQFLQYTHILDYHNFIEFVHFVNKNHNTQKKNDKKVNLKIKK